jgi:hypothetical protein
MRQQNQSDQNALHDHAATLDPPRPGLETRRARPSGVDMAADSSQDLYGAGADLHAALTFREQTGSTY